VYAADASFRDLFPEWWSKPVKSLLVILLVLTGLWSASPAFAQESDAPPPVLEVRVPLILSERPHDAQAFTQGLLLHDGLFYESTGLYGQSTLREVDPATGEVLRRFNLPAEIFAEGLALVGDRLIQLSWREGVAIEYALDTFEPARIYNYNTEGWGLCYDGVDLWMSDGSASLFRRDADTFALIETLPVTMGGRPVLRLNELECVGDSVYANVWMDDHIVVIDKQTGVVHTLIDASAIVASLGLQDDTSAVLNGIAYDPASGAFYITGKLWPALYEVRFVQHLPAAMPLHFP
jgi:glutamine cyclotransferase